MSDRLRELLDTMAERGEERAAADVYVRAATRARRRVRTQRTVVALAAVVAVAVGVGAVAGRDQSETTFETTPDVGPTASTAPPATTSGVTTTWTPPTSVTIPDVTWQFDADHGVSGTVMRVEIGGLEDYVGRTVSLSIRGAEGRYAAAGEDVVRPDGRLVTDFYVSYGLTDELDDHDVRPFEPGEYVVRGSLPWDGGWKTFERRFRVERAKIGETYRHVIGRGCAQIVGFDARTWVPLPESEERAKIPVREGTIRLVSEDRAVFESTETGPVTLREVTVENPSPYDPELDPCPN